MNTEIKLTGGARVGWINASWPFGRMNVTSSKIIINATLLGKYEFRPEDVTSIETVGSLPLIGRGIRVHHNIADYPDKIIFWTTKNPDNLIDDIRRLGFSPKGTQSAMIRDHGFPIRWQAIIIFVVLWNALMLLDMFKNGAFHPKPGPFAWLATVLVFILSVTIWKSALIKKAILSPGHNPSEIKSFLYLLTFVTGFLSLMLGLELLK
jgi:hypothetical protein